ncbi:SDR family NAD(P)-dependent oxidoreductase [Pseudobacteriovorax antillogorgiicola]|uniref:Polyketide synthase dehydratase n=1 Tax=Pseudobacteriovorax antillogorgiicola TaxID=1513793 RepID=A0A1Y6CPK4_9BACT|nr:SDR family NAD(P)-dependent oxidoreductase [Pseudobacteriovorax antillogorgiicola]TCS46915.1 polyketide synthase-like dehydratase family protein [Pseudobacteriovorax antillogorgiicola]SMF64151.1 Polyketide synthase dehydratase [Pseudobacteriovorax antillogorgiicola]
MPGFQKAIPTEVLPIMILDDGRGVAAELARLLQNHHLHAKVVKKLTGHEQSLVDLSALFAKSDQAFSLFQHARVIARNCQDTSGIYMVAQGHGFIPEEGLGINQYQGATGAIPLAKTMAKELPQLICKGVNLDATEDSKSFAKQLFEELIYGGHDIDIAYRNGQRYLVDITSFDVTSFNKSWQPLNDHDVVLVSGGARGVTASCIQALAETKPLKIAILGRSPLNVDQDRWQPCRTQKDLMTALFQEAKDAGESPQVPAIKNLVDKVLREREVKANLKAMEDAGSQVAYYPVDVTNQDDIKEIINQIQSSWGPIKGLVHGAGVLADKLIKDKSDDDFKWVYKTKVLGLENLLAAGLESSLTHLCVFSSVAGRVGNLGQADYAMANERLNKICQDLQGRRPNLVVKSLGWGPWDGGMVTDSLKKHFAAQGISVIPLDEGAKIFVNQLQNGDGQVEIVVGSAMELARAETGPLDYSILVSEAQHPYLKSHQVKGRVVVPVVLLVEWISRLTESFAKQGELHQIKVYKGIIIDDFELGEWIQVRIENDQIQAFHQGKLCFGARLRQKTERPHQRTVLSSSCPWHRDLSPYDDALFHGHDFQVIRRLDHASSEGCQGTLAASASLDGQDRAWNTNCAVLDGGLQLAVTWFKDKTSMDSLPTDIEAVQVFESPKFGEDVTCYLTLRHQTKLKSQWDIDYEDDQGRTLARITGLSIHAVPTGY